MTPEELAIHWNMALKEAENIANIINYHYSVELVSIPHSSSDIWKVVLRANDGKKNYTLMEQGRDFSNKDQAIIHGSRWAQHIKMTPGQAQNMGVPQDAFLSLKPMEGYEQACKRLQLSPIKISTRQYE